MEEREEWRKEGLWNIRKEGRKELKNERKEGRKEGT